MRYTTNAIGFNEMHCMLESHSPFMGEALTEIIIMRLAGKPVEDVLEFILPRYVLEKRVCLDSDTVTIERALYNAVVWTYTEVKYFKVLADAIRHAPSKKQIVLYSVTSNDVVIISFKLREEITHEINRNPMVIPQEGICQKHSSGDSSTYWHSFVGESLYTD